jgi:hypothetical protein
MPRHPKDGSEKELIIVARTSDTPCFAGQVGRWLSPRRVAEFI